MPSTNKPAEKPLYSGIRIAQQQGNNSISVNITEVGADYHEINAGTATTVRVYPNGIWISRSETPAERESDE